jgi:hypothetical protein
MFYKNLKNRLNLLRWCYLRFLPSVSSLNSVISLSADFLTLNRSEASFRKAAKFSFISGLFITIIIASASAFESLDGIVIVGVSRVASRNPIQSEAIRGTPAHKTSEDRSGYASQFEGIRTALHPAIISFMPGLNSIKIRLTSWSLIEI